MFHLVGLKQCCIPKISSPGRPPQSAGTGNQVPRHILLKKELSGTIWRTSCCFVMNKCPDSPNFMRLSGTFCNQLLVPRHKFNLWRPGCQSGMWPSSCRAARWSAAWVAQWVLDAGQDGQTKLLGQDVLVQLRDGVWSFQSRTHPGFSYARRRWLSIVSSFLRVGDGAVELLGVSILLDKESDEFI